MSPKKFSIILIITILVIFLIRLFYSITNAPTLNCSAILSVEAAKSIVETGIPAKDGVLYARDYLVHYLLAGSIFIIGDNFLGYVTPNLIFSILVLILLYFVARTFTTSKIVIFLTIFTVAISTIENTYAINPRCYMQFQFFFLLTIFYFYKGFVDKNNKQGEKYQILTFFSYLASVLSHTSGLILLPVFGFYVITKNKKWYQDKLILIISALVILFSTFYFFIVFPGAITNPNFIHFDLPYNFKFQIPFLEKDPTNLTSRQWEGPSGISVSNLISYFPYIFAYLPFISLFIFVGIIKLIFNHNKDHKLAYLYCVFLSSLFFISLFTLYAEANYIFCLFPIFALISFLGMECFIQFINNKKFLKSKHLGWILIIILIAVLTKEHPAYDFKDYSNVPAYGFHSFFSNHQPAISYLLENKREKDIIIADNPAVYGFYLDHCDYYLRQRKLTDETGEKITWVTVRPQDQLPFFRIPPIDSINKLKKVLDNNQRVWLVLSRNNIGSELKYYIRDNMKLEFKVGNYIYIYSNEKR